MIGYSEHPWGTIAQPLFLCQVYFSFILRITVSTTSPSVAQPARRQKNKTPQEEHSWGVPQQGGAAGLAGLR